MIINQTLANHTIVVEALQRLSRAMLRQNNPYHEPVNTDLINMFDDLRQKDKEADSSAVAKLSVSGDLEKVSEELYSPSSNIFDQNEYNAFFALPEVISGDIQESDFSGDNDIGCAACYTIKFNDKTYAVIKNYHTLTVIDYSQTSWNYPVLIIEDLSPTPQITGGRLGYPSFGDNLDTAASVLSLSYPLTVVYTTTQMSVESLDPTPNLYSISYPNEYLYETYSTVPEGIDTTPTLYSITYPLTVAYITYTSPHEALDSSGVVYSLTLS